MNKFTLYALGFTLIAIASSLFLFQSLSPSPPSSTLPTTPPHSRSNQTQPIHPPSPQTSLPPTTTPTSSMKVEQAYSTIEEATVTYNASAIPRIAPFLSHPSPEVRLAAIRGLVDLGESAASPILRDAAQKSKFPDEATRMVEAANYLELPSGSMQNLIDSTRAAAEKNKNSSPTHPSTPIKQPSEE